MLLVSTKNQDTNVDVETVTKNRPPDVLTSMNVKPMQKVNVQQHCVIIVLIKFSNFLFLLGIQGPKPLKISSKTRKRWTEVDPETFAIIKIHDVAICSNTVGSFDCHCPEGYEGDGVNSCENINECDIRNEWGYLPCSPNAQCQDYQGLGSTHHSVGIGAPM